MKANIIAAVGIDVSKGKSTICVRRPGGEIVTMPYEVAHTAPDLTRLIHDLYALDGEIRVVMEHTGMYWLPIAAALKQAGFFVSVINAKLIHDFADNRLRKTKTDKADSLKIANYALTFWDELREYTDTDNTRQLLKRQCRVYNTCQKSATVMKNCLIAQLDMTFPGVNRLFNVEPRMTNGHIKWVDFVKKFYHKDCVAGMSLNAFSDRYRKWCAKERYHFSQVDVDKIHVAARSVVATLPCNDSSRALIQQAAATLDAILESQHALKIEMRNLAEQLPEYPAVTALFGAGGITAPQLMAEIGDVRKFTHKGALVAFAGVDAPEYQSGTFEAKSRRVSKRGSPHLRKTLFQICSSILQHTPQDEPVFQFMDKKRAEGKHYYVYMVAGANKFLRLYYGRVRAYLNSLEIAA